MDEERRFELSPGEEEEEEEEEEEGAGNSAGMVLEVQIPVMMGNILKNPAVQVYVALFWCCSCCCLCRSTIPLCRL